jgi:hypothetical protein
MMKLLIAIALIVTGLTALVLRPSTSCEARGGVYKELESVNGGEPTKVCVPALIRVVPY